MAFHAIKAGEGDVYVAAGVESISQVDGYPKDSEELHPKLVGEGAIANVYIPMGLTAENVAERCDVSREDMDRFAQRSQERAVAAQASGFFDARADAVHEGGRHRRLRRRRAAAELDVREAAGARSRRSSPDGKVTAGNACPLNDGAAALVIMSEERAQRARRAAAGADHRSSAVTGRRPGDHGRRADRRRAQVLAQRRDDDRRRRRRWS